MPGMDRLDLPEEVVPWGECDVGAPIAMPAIALPDEDDQPPDPDPDADAEAAATGYVEVSTRTASAPAVAAAPATGWRAASSRPGDRTGTAWRVGTIEKASSATNGAALGSVPMPVNMPPN